MTINKCLVFSYHILLPRSVSSFKVFNSYTSDKKLVEAFHISAEAIVPVSLDAQLEF